MPPLAAPPPAVPGQQTVTLVSGDRVSFTGSGDSLQVSGVTPGKGRERIAFTRARFDGHEYVIPVDATAPLAADRLDQRLFDVTALAEQGYDDSARKDIPLITTEQAAPALKGARNQGEFDTLGLTARTVHKTEAARAWQGFLTQTSGTSRTARASRLWLDAKVSASLDRSVAMTGANEAWRKGLEGRGVKVAVLDTGYDQGHPDLKGKVTAEKNFTWDESVQDRNGHGTHVASTVAGDGAASGGRYRGVAPGAELLVGKVLDAGGTGQISWILEGMEWATTQDADVVSMSLGSSEPSDGTDPLSQAVEKLSADGGPLFVVAAGNDGAPRTIGSPAAAPSALTVGSITKQRAMSTFSSQGPALADAGVKPEITAPGSDITAARAQGTLADAAVGERYATISGTSMATPHVSGAAAILKQRHPEWDARQLKAALVGTADAVKGAGVYEQGAGSVDVPGALAAGVTASPTAVSAELVWPYEGAAGEFRAITYRNPTPKPIHLTLSLEGHAPVALADRRLTVPAGGTVQAAVRIDARRAEPGTHSAWVVARGSNGSRVRTPVGIDAERPSATLTVEPAAHRPGVDRTYTNLVVQNEKTGEAQLVSAADEAQRLRLPLGTYRVFGDVWEYVEYGTVGVARSSVTLAQRVTLTGDRTVEPDVSGAEPVRRSIDDPDMRINEQGSAAGLVSTTGSGATTGLVAPIFGGRHQAYAVGSARIPGLTYFSAASWQQPYVRATVVGSPDPVDIDVSLLAWQRQEWDVRGQVTDAGTAADLAGLELKDRVVLFDPGYGTPYEEATRRYEAIKAQGPAAVLIGSGWVDFDLADPPLSVSEPGMALLRERLADGPVTLEIKGQRNGGRTYFTFHTRENGVPAGADWTDRRRDLVPVEHAFRTTGYPNDPKGIYGWVTYEGLQLAQQWTLFRAPHRMTAYYTPDVRWTTATFEYAVDAGALGVQYTDPILYRRSRSADTLEDNWLTGPFNPSLSVTGADGRPQATRDGDKLRLALPMFSDAAGHRSERVRELETGGTVLRDAASGTVVGRNDQPGQGVFDVPSKARWYELTATARRDSPEWPLATEVSDVWRFRSAHTRGESALPLLDTRYEVPGLDGDNSVPEGREFGFDLGFAYQKGAPRGGDVDRASVSYSTDDGATWQAAEVRRSGDGWRVTVPGMDTGWVSLKVAAEARGGGSLTETVTRAYRVGCAEYWCDFAPDWPHWRR